MKASRLGGKSVIFAIALERDETTSFDLTIGDYISESALPISPGPDATEALGRIITSEARLKEFTSLFNSKIIQKLVPLLQEGVHEKERGVFEPLHQRAPDSQPTREPLREDPLREPARPYPFDDPLAAPPRNPINPPIPAGDFAPPGFEDEYEVNRPPRGFPQGFAGGRPLNIGERDLYPPGLGPHDPLRGYMGPGSGGGMHPTFDDPMFGGNNGGRGENNLQAPPGARYDPVGPGDGPPMGRGRGPGFPGGFRGGPGGPFGGSFGGGFGGGDII